MEHRPQSVPLTPGAVPIVGVPDHELVRLIGKGSYGDVWLARTAVGTYRAVKIVYEQTFRHKRPFEREFNGVQKFEPISRLHEGLVDILQIGRNEAGGYFYCVMELADDAASGPIIDPENYSPRTLAQELATHQRLRIEDCLRITGSIASALAFLHQSGLIHRDIKPSNIVFIKGVPKLADIGLVAEMSEARSYVGTEGFIPPEGPGTASADIYSLGKVLYEISTGKDRHDYPELPPPLSDPAEERSLIEVNKIILKACRTDAAQRYESAAEMAADLHALLRGERPRNSSRTRVRPAIKMALAVAAIGVMAGWFLRLDRAVQPPARSETPGSNVVSAPIPAPRGLVGWWRAEDDARDAVGGNQGELTGTTTYDGGAVGRSFVFESAGDMVLLNNTTNLQLQNFTIEAWIQRSDPKRVTRDPHTTAQIFGYGQDGYSFGLGEDGALALSKTHVIGIAMPRPITDTEFHHIAVTKAGNLVVFYVDGAAYPANNFNATFEFHTAPAIGSRSDRRGGFLGRIDEVSVYNEPLWGDEIQAIYRAGRAGKSPPPENIPAPPGLVGWWRAEGNAEDSAGPNGGTLYGISFRRGIVGRAFDVIPFMGRPSPCRVRVPDHDDFKLIHSLTIEGWIYIRTGSGVVFHRGDDREGWDPYSLAVDEEGRLQFQVQSLTGTAGLVAPIAIGAWKHVAATLDGASGNLKLFVDGQVVAATNTPVRPFAELDPRFNPAIGIGNVGDLEGTNCLNGSLDEMALYSRALSGKEVQAIYAAGGSGKRPPAVPVAGEGPRIVPAPEMAFPVAAPRGLVGWWQGEGDARDATGNSDGVLRNGASFVPGRVGRAFSFNGVNQFVAVPRTPALDPGDEVTVEFWMKADLENPLTDRLQGLVTTDHYGVEIAPGWTFRTGVNFFVWNGDDPLGDKAPLLSHANGGAAMISSGNWHHVATTYDGARLVLYIDGKAWGKPFLRTGPIDPMRPGSFLTIGGIDGRTAAPSLGPRYFHGLIDEVSIYNRALCADEIAAIHAAGSAGKTLPPFVPALADAPLK